MKIKDRRRKNTSVGSHSLTFVCNIWFVFWHQNHTWVFSQRLDCRIFLSTTQLPSWNFKGCSIFGISFPSPMLENGQGNSWGVRQREQSCANFIFLGNPLGEKTKDFISPSKPTAAPGSFVSVFSCPVPGPVLQSSVVEGQSHSLTFTFQVLLFSFSGLEQYNNILRGLVPSLFLFRLLSEFDVPCNCEVSFLLSLSFTN